MSISHTSSRTIGVTLLQDHPERFVMHAPDGQKVCEFTVTLREHPQLIGAWLVNIESHPGDSTSLVIKTASKNPH